MRFCSRCHRASIRLILILARASASTRSSSSIRGKTFCVSQLPGDFKQCEIFFFNGRRLRMFEIGTKCRSPEDLFPCIHQRRSQFVRKCSLIKWNNETIDQKLGDDQKNQRSFQRQSKGNKRSFRRKIHNFVFCDRDF